MMDLREYAEVLANALRSVRSVFYDLFSVRSVLCFIQRQMCFYRCVLKHANPAPGAYSRRSSARLMDLEGRGARLFGTGIRTTAVITVTLELQPQSLTMFQMYSVPPRTAITAFRSTRESLHVKALHKNLNHVHSFAASSVVQYAPHVLLRDGVFRPRWRHPPESLSMALKHRSMSFAWNVDPSVGRPKKPATFGGRLLRRYPCKEFHADSAATR